MWERLPPSTKVHPHMPESLGATGTMGRGGTLGSLHGMGRHASPGAASGDNVTRVNIQRGQYTARNKRTDQMAVQNPMNKYGFDVLERVDSVYQRTPLMSLSRPNPAEVSMRSQPKVTDAERMKDPSKAGCSFLHRVPGDLPRDAHIDVCHDLEKDFLHPLKNFQKGKQRKAEGKLQHIYMDAAKK